MTDSSAPRSAPTAPGGGAAPGPTGDGAWDRWRRRILPILLLAAIALFLDVVRRHYPISRWLFWRYAAYWALAAVWSAACVASGRWVLRRVLRAPLPLLEELVTSFALGTYVFYLGMFAGGMLRLYGPVFFAALPLALLGATGLPLFRALRRYARHVRHRRRSAPRPALWVYPAIALGALGVLMVYFLILTPGNVAYDARWKHLAIAEDYAAFGGIRRFDEGWSQGTDPHLASHLYTWAFLLPKGRLFDRVELAAHLELFGFLWTLAGVSALVRRLVPRAPAGVVWAARFLFPGVLLYDSSLTAAADHIAAIYVIPLYTLLLRAWRDLDPRACALVAAMTASACLVKYSSALMLAPIPAIVLLLRAGQLALRRRAPGDPPRGVGWWAGPLAALAAGLVLSAPHWLKNWIWYGDPLYPSLHKILTPRPWTPDSADLFTYGLVEHQLWQPKRDLSGVIETLKALVTFSFVPNDWGKLHGKVPVFGSLFTLLLVTLPFLRKTRRIWGLAAATHVALFAWYWIHHQDRYLQTLLPWMTAATAATLVLLWRSGLLTRLFAGALVGLQIVWGGDVYFIPTHAMVGSPIKASVDLLAAGYARQYDKRLAAFGVWADVGRALPPRARVLVHDSHVRLGLGATAVSDWGGWQFGLSYGRLGGARQVHDALMDLGVTHLLWEDSLSRGWDSIAGDIAFFQFATRYGVGQRRYGSFVLAAMPKTPPPDEESREVAYIGCRGRGYRTGLYRASDMTAPVFGPSRLKFPAPSQPGPPAGASIEALVAGADFVVLDPSCQASTATALTPHFTLLARRTLVNGPRSGFVQLWIRRAGPKAPRGGAPAPGE